MHSPAPSDSRTQAGSIRARLKLLHSGRATALLAALVGTAGVLAYSLPSWASAESGGRAAPVPPVPAFAGKILHLRSTSYINYDVVNTGLPAVMKARQANETNEAWIEEGAGGTALRIRGTTRLPDGTVTQDRLFDASNAIETVNFFGWEDTTQACSQQIPLKEPGSGFETTSDSWLASNGFQSVDRPAEVIAAGGSGRAYEDHQAFEAGGPFLSMRRVLVLSRTTTQVLGAFVYVTLPDGKEVLSQSTITSAVEVLPSVPEATFAQLPALPLCSHAPQEATS